MKIKVSEATNIQLNWLVATIEVAGKPQEVSLGACTDGSISVRIRPANPILNDRKMVMAPTTEWSQAGPIIAREKIETYWHNPLEMWAAKHDGNLRYGFTPLIAAMRCYVASKMGDEVDVPEELL